jgi:hypothetical protein
MRKRIPFHERAQDCILTVLALGYFAGFFAAMHLALAKLHY